MKKFIFSAVLILATTLSAFACGNTEYSRAEATMGITQEETRYTDYTIEDMSSIMNNFLDYRNHDTRSLDYYEDLAINNAKWNWTKSAKCQDKAGMKRAFSQMVEAMEMVYPHAAKEIMAKPSSKLTKVRNNAF